MNISQDYILKLPNDRNFAVLQIGRDLMGLWESFSSDDDELHHQDTFIDALALLQYYEREKEIDYPFEQISTSDPSWTHSLYSIIERMLKELEQVERESKLSRSQNKIAMLMGEQFCYTFTDGDLKKLERLISELKKTVEATEEIDSDHKSRILKRLNELENELSKTVSNLDRYYGLLVEANILVSKIGNTSKPIVVLIRSVIDIVWSTQSNAEELPSDTHLSLPTKDEEIYQSH